MGMGQLGEAPGDSDAAGPATAERPWRALARPLDRRLLLVSFCVALALLLAVFGPLIPHWFPSSDDLTVIPHAALRTPGARWTDWFTTGFRDYYQPSSPSAETGPLPYYRPLVDALYWLAWRALGARWPLWEVVTLSLHAAGVATAVGVARRGFGLGFGASCVAGGLMLACPAVLAPGPLNIFSYNNELLLAPLAGAAFLLVRRGDFALAALCLLAALLIKETSLWLVPAAALSAVFYRADGVSIGRRLADAAIAVAPLVAYLGLRLLVGAPVVLGSVLLPGYLTGHESLARVALLHLKLWPSGFVQPGLVHNLTSDPRPVMAVVIASIAVNLYCWILLAGLAARVGYRVLPARLHGLCRVLRAIGGLAIGGGRADPDPLPGAPDAGLPALWALSGAAFLLLAPTDEARYGYSEAAFLIPAFLAAAAWRPTAAFLGTVSVCWLALLASSGAAPWMASPGMAAARNLASAIAGAPARTREIDAIGGPTFLGAVAAIFGRPVITAHPAYLLKNCDGPAAWRVTHRRDGDVAQYAVAFPACAMALPSRQVVRTAVTGLLSRGPDGAEYELTTVLPTPALRQGPEPPGWLFDQGFVPRSRWPASLRPLANILTVRMTLSRPTRLIVENPTTGEPLSGMKRGRRAARG
jgi:hypothetical protein